LLAYLNSKFGLGFDAIPCPNSIENWVKKSGYAIYHDRASAMPDAPYAEVADETALHGGEKALTILGIAASKVGRQVLRKQDVRVLVGGTEVGPKDA
jgi:hypothetical protein